MSNYIKSVSKASLSLGSTSERKGTELKYYDALAGSTSISTTFTMLHPDLISVGTSPNQRVGRTIRITRIDVGGWITPADVSNGVRIIVCNREAGYIASPNLTVGNTHYAPLNVLEEKISFYADQFVGFPAQSYSGSTTYPVVPYTKSVGFGKKGLLVRFNTANHIAQNMPIVAFISDSGAISHPVFLGYVRFYFTDA